MPNEGPSETGHAKMSLNGSPVDEKDMFGCEVTHDITDPDMIIVMDEVGGNTSLWEY